MGEAAAAGGGSVGFFAPSGFLPDAAVMDRAAGFFTARGWRVSAGDSVFTRELRFAGPDALRAQELQSFATDRQLDVAIAARGGYGLTRLLDGFDYAAVAAAGVPLVGYSDFTAFGLALLARAGGASFQGPAASDFFLDEPATGRKVQDSARFNQEHFFAALSEETPALRFRGDPGARPHAGLDLRGRLWGGNLSMICSLLGTPHFPRVRGGLLFVEDVNEPAYRIERLLLQLLQAGVLGAQKALILGDFTSMPALATDNGYALDAALDAVRARCEVPIVGGLPFGHGHWRATLGVGVPGRLTVAAVSPSAPAPRYPVASAGAADTPAEACVDVTLSFSGHPRLRTGRRAP